MKMPKEYEKLLKLAQEQGWRVRHRPRSARVYLLPPDKSHRPIPLACTPAVHKRGLKNTVGQLRRAGLQVPTDVGT